VRSAAFSQSAGGRFVFTAHLKPAGSFESDFVAVAEMFRHVPYYWGGKSVQGLDCSGLVQLALEACGNRRCATPTCRRIRSAKD
jgi:cell wall-associated NlpC family hydrolase